MLNKNSCQLATNLSLMLYEQKKDLTPVAGTLMQELSVSSFFPLYPEDTNLENLPNAIHNACLGSVDKVGGKNSYNNSKHDAIMDNYIDTISTLVTNHVQFARAVVYPKVQYLAEQVNLALKSYEIQQPEDFFEVSMYILPEVFQTNLVDTEVVNFDTAGVANHVMNFGDSVKGDFNLQEYVNIGDSQEDALISKWIASVGMDKLNSYLFSPSTYILAALPLHELIDYSFINFLFYRSLTFRQDLSAGLSVIQLTTRSSDNRDYYARELKAALNTYHLQIKQGVILSANSDVSFSYLSNKRFSITIYEESFTKAVQQGATLEQVFGYISRYANVSLTADMLKEQGALYSSGWNTVRGLYMTHITSHRDVALKMALKLKTTEAIYHNLSEEDSEFFKSNNGFEQKTAEMINAYVGNLDTTALDRTNDIFIDLIAAIAYRHTSAARIIREMVYHLEQDATMEPVQAALASTVKYLTDFLIEEITVTS